MSTVKIKELEETAWARSHLPYLKIAKEPVRCLRNTSNDTKMANADELKAILLIAVHISVKKMLRKHVR